MIKYETIKSAIEDIETDWGDDGKKVIELAFNNPLHITLKEFMNNCTAMGGNWGGMLLSGIKRLRPEVWEAIPDNMGNRGFVIICATITLLGVDMSEED